MAINLQSMSVEDIIQMILAQKANSPEAQQPSRFDFAQAGGNSPAPDPAQLPSRFDFAQAAPQPPPIPQELLNPTPSPDIGGPPVPTPAPREALAKMMMQPPDDPAGYTTSGRNPIYAGGSSAVFGRNARK